MHEGELRTILNDIGISQAEFARLINVTPRAVSLWMVGSRAIPGAVEAYARLLLSLPPGQRQVELARLKERKSTMREGMYAVVFKTTTRQGENNGAGVLVLEGGRAYGADPGLAKYDGTYVYNEETGVADVQIKVTFPPNGEAVFGVSHPYEWAFEGNCKINLNLNPAKTVLRAPTGDNIDIDVIFLRTLPDS
jgi:hypothetical protein